VRKKGVSRIAHSSPKIDLNESSKEENEEKQQERSGSLEKMEQV
jgi:hypothetical protein